MDKYQSAGAPVEPPENEEDARQKILDKLSDIERRREALSGWSPPERAAKKRSSGDVLDLDDEAEQRKNDVSKFFQR